MWWETTLLYFFSWSFIWFGQKESIKVQNFILSTAHVKFHQICTLIGSFCWKYLKFQLNKYREVMSHDSEEWCKIWKKPWFFVSKISRIWWILTQVFEIIKTSTLISSFCAKSITLDLKKYRGVISHDTEEWCKIWRKTACGLESDMRNLANFTRGLKSLKIGTLMGSFYPK